MSNVLFKNPKQEPSDNLTWKQSNRTQTQNVMSFRVAIVAFITQTYNNNDNDDCFINR